MIEELRRQEYKQTRGKKENKQRNKEIVRKKEPRGFNRQFVFMVVKFKYNSGDKGT
jgi:hypothetical protein